MRLGLFVTGTDTGVGKTLISAALVQGFARRGYKAAGMKPVASGCRSEQGMLVSDDVEMLRTAANVALPPAVINPYAFEPPLAPHIAAHQANGWIAINRIHEAFLFASRMADVLMVEGVGGFCVPLNEDEDTADLAVALALPVVLVVGMRLGCLNHALLSVEAIRSRGLPLAGWVANCVDRDMLEVEKNIAALHRRIPAPCLGVVPFQPSLNVQSVSDMLEYDKFL